MPQALEVDHEYVKGVCYQVGIREGARQLGLSEELVMKWAQRENWRESWRQMEQCKQVKIEKQGLSAIVRKTPSELLAGYKLPTKLAQAKAVHKTARAFSKMDGESLTTRTKEVKDNVDSAAKLWPEAEGQGQTLIAIQLNGYVPPQATAQ